MRFDHIVSDPPWAYANRLSGKGRTRFGSGASGKYRVEKTSDMAAFPVGSLASDDGCNLHMWVTGPFLPDAFRLFEAYGFTFTTIEFVWVKINTKWISMPRSKIIQCLYALTLLPFLLEICFRGPGHYTASNVELVLLAYKNGPRLPKIKLFPQLIFAPRMKHSQKPDDVHEYIETAYPGERYIELFARREREGWTCLGNEIDGRDVRDSIPHVVSLPERCQEPTSKSGPQTPRHASSLRLEELQ